MSIYLDVLSPMRRLNLTFQKYLHDPVKVVCRVQEFTWTMLKLQILIENTLDSQDGITTSYKKFLSEIVEKESEKKRKIQYFCQVKFKKFKILNTNVRNNYTKAICNIADCIEEHFSSLYESPLFKHVVTMLDVSTWPPVSSAEKFGDQEIIEMTTTLKIFLVLGQLRLIRFPLNG